MNKSVKQVSNFFNEEDDDTEPKGMNMKDSPSPSKHTKIFFNF